MCPSPSTSVKIIYITVLGHGPQRVRYICAILCKMYTATVFSAVHITIIMCEMFDCESAQVCILLMYSCQGDLLQLERGSFDFWTPGFDHWWLIFCHCLLTYVKQVLYALGAGFKWLCLGRDTLQKCHVDSVLSV